MIQAEYNKIIPTDIFKGEHGEKLDLKAIVFYVATGFFFENDTFWKDTKWEALNYEKQPWKYEPRKISFDDAVEEFAQLFHKIIDEQTREGKVILPLSGGLDSRTMAVALKHLGKTPFTYSYRFTGSFNETSYGKKIAQTLGWEFEDITIPPSYLWDQIEEAGNLNGCYSEFTHARQVAVAERLSKKGDVWLLGHWGDVLFDDMHVNPKATFEEQVDVLQNKVLKKGGLELAKDLWKAWNLEGDFEVELKKRITKMHQRINIDNVNARVRAFKSLYWATRWTSTNLVYFSHYNPMALPYYDDRMCEFIMTLPEEFLADRKIQIAYIKKYSPELAKIAWQEKAPYNLYNYHKHLTKAHLPFMILRKLKHVINHKVLGKPLVQRNWEIQFLGNENEEKLKTWLFDNQKFKDFVPKELVESYFEKFKNKDGVYWSHPLSMLLTLSVFSKTNKWIKS